VRVPQEGAAKNNDQDEVGQVGAAESDAHAVAPGDLCGETRGDAAQVGSEHQQHPQTLPAVQTRRLRGRALKPSSVPPLSAPEGVVTRGRVKGGQKKDPENLEGGEAADAGERPPELKRRRGGRQPRDASKPQKREASPAGLGVEAEGQSHQIGELKVNRASTPMSRANSNQNNQIMADDPDQQASVVAPVLQTHHSLQVSTGAGRPAQSAIAASGAHPVPAAAAAAPVSHFQLNQVSIATDVRQGGGK
jgi:hypothetical protein